MAALTFRLANVTLASAYGELIETDQAAANTGTSWKVAKTIAGGSSDMVWGATGTVGFTTETSSPKPTAMGTSDSAALRSLNPYSGIFGATAWTLTFAVRASTASSQRGRMRVRVYKGSAIDGSDAVEQTGSTQVGTTSTALSTTVDVTTVVTWTPSSTITFNNEYLFIMCAWEITTASGSNNGDVILRTGTSTTGTEIVTSNFSNIYADSGSPSSVTDISGSSEVYTPGGTEYDDSDSPAIITALSASEIAVFADATTCAGFTSISAGEVYTPGTTTQKAYPISDVIAGDWQGQDNSVVNLYSYIDETTPNDSDYIYSVAS